MGLPEGADISTGDADEVARGQAVLERALEILADLGSEHLCGVLYERLKKYPGPATPQGRRASQDVIGHIAQRAADLGITVSLEVVNRYEQNLFNTADAALEYIEQIGVNSLKVHLDSYHMNIEESDMYLPVLAAARRTPRVRPHR